MCGGDVTYRVLWIEDQELDSIRKEADLEGVELIQFKSLKEAERELKERFNDYSAIVLDAFCLLKEDSEMPDNNFLMRAGMMLSGIFTKKCEEIPWYVLSAGTMDHFAESLAGINTEERQQREEDWGKLFYPKNETEEREQLYHNIIRVAENKPFNKVLYRHKELFDLLGDGRFINCYYAREIMLKLLSALYYPEYMPSFECSSNPVRSVIEYLFDSLYEKGLLPEECIVVRRNTLDCSKFVSGMVLDRYPDYNIQYDGTIIDDKNLSPMLQNLINYEAKGCHVIDGKYKIDDTEKEIFFGNVLILCHIIKWFGRYVAKHPDAEENRKRIIRIAKQQQNTVAAGIHIEDTTSTDDIEQYEGKVFLPEMDDNGIWHCGDCVFNTKVWEEGKQIKLSNIKTNNGKSQNSRKYKYFAGRIEIQE